MTTSNASVLQVNVGFILHQESGYVREVDFEAADITLADDLHLHQFNGTAQLTRTPLGIVVEGAFDAQYDTTCTRCLDNVQQVPLHIDVHELYVFPYEDGAELFITDARNLDLAPLVSQEMTLAEQMTVLCKPDCLGLCPTCGTNLNHETCTCASDDVDQRLAVLRQLLDD